jgi:hypothetical protein
LASNDVQGNCQPEQALRNQQAIGRVPVMEGKSGNKDEMVDLDGQDFNVIEVVLPPHEFAVRHWNGQVSKADFVSRSRLVLNDALSGMESGMAKRYRGFLADTINVTIPYQELGWQLRIIDTWKSFRLMSAL